ncbi:hypothetical protein OH76DRAFT_943457 [Lentinus brumalis]|uniref:Protein kinase domain-containing protein n=1 Tax=Lentinus brumalis TaxID=2498619 RepID=A0A371CZ36_9APHY|nr:hypothetical protein OH76DRAFT_943457 [Polyporus brumalis]
MTMVALRINLTLSSPIDCHRRVLTMLRLTLLSDTQLLLQTPGPAEARTCVLEAPHADTESYKFTEVTEEISARDDPECEKERPYGDRLRVFRGMMLQESTGKELKVVFKVAYDEPCLLLLANEAEIYTEHLVKVQGEYVPRMYGSFVGETDEGKTRVTVLEDWGEELRIPLKVQPVKFRLLVVKALLEIHRRANVVHHDFADRHIVVKTTPTGYWPVLVDFTKALLHPDECLIEWPFKVYALEPVMAHTCHELWDVISEEAELWCPSHLNFFNVHVPVAEVSEPADLLKYTPDWVECSEAQLMAQAKSVYSKYVEWLRERRRCDRMRVRIH